MLTCIDHRQRSNRRNGWFRSSRLNVGRLTIPTAIDLLTGRWWYRLRIHRKNEERKERPIMKAYIHGELRRSTGYWNPGWNRSSSMEELAWLLFCHRRRSPRVVLVVWKVDILRPWIPHRDYRLRGYAARLAWWKLRNLIISGSKIIPKKVQMLLARIANDGYWRSFESEQSRTWALGTLGMTIRNHFI